MTTYTDLPVPIIDLQLCVGCGVCADACPSGAFELKDGKAVISVSGNCSYSGICEYLCPEGAISRSSLDVSL